MPQPKIYESHAQRQNAYRKRREQARHLQMAAKGLPVLPALPTVPGWARWNQAMGNMYELMTLVQDEMQTYFEERSEQWQESERAEVFQELVEALTNLCQQAEDWIEACPKRGINS
jgi:hypothetical protein